MPRPIRIPVFRGKFTETHAERLLWRAGFGPRPDEARAISREGLDRAVFALTRPRGRPRLIGLSPRDERGKPLDPAGTWGHDHSWWLDRMVRSNQSLVGRMTLIWHSWFATSLEGSSSALMLRQNMVMRDHALGNFETLFVRLTRDPAMLLWLNGASNTAGSPNENYGREMMELFTLGPDRGAYTQDDVHEQARALTGFDGSWKRQRHSVAF